MNRRNTVTLVSALSLLACCGTTLAGPLNPPAGAVGASMKTLTEVEPRTAVSAANTPGDAGAVFKITQPGSYYLTGDVTIPAGKNGVVITASNVTLDLNGFSIVGATSQAQHGVQSSGVKNIVVRNGTLRSMGGAGVFFDGASCRVEKVSVLACNGSGVYLPGAGCVVEGCLVDTSEGTGVYTGESGVVRDCTVTGAYYGVSVGSKSTVTGCVSSHNNAGGYAIECNSKVEGCLANSNAQEGFFLCSSEMSGCSATGNTGTGIYAGGGSTVRDCKSTSNQAEGIKAMSQCTITGNMVRSNAGAGIRLTSTSNRVEGNQMFQNAKGVHAEGTGNVVIGNTSVGNTVAFVLVAGNRYGQIVAIDSVAGVAAVNGSSAASTLTTTDPHANFVH